MSNFKFRTWPTEFKLITQHFGARPWVYQRFGFPGHEGIDFQAPKGTKIFCVAPGVVTEVFHHNGQHNYGNHIRVQHEDGYETVYAHLDEIGVQLDQKVRSGQLLGLAGETGFVEGAHLHLTLKRQGASASGYPRNVIDPTPFVLPLLDPDWNDATFVRDTVPDGTVMSMGAFFVQTWTMRNSGRSTWEDGYSLVHVDGERMEAPERVPLPPAPPGAEVPVSLLLRTPATPGLCRSTFQPCDPAGNRFGDPVWAEIEVVAPSGVARSAGDPARFVECNGTEFRINGRAFRFFGINLRGLIHYGRMSEEPLKHSQLDHRASQLQAAYSLGARVARIFLADKNATADEIVARLRETLDIVKTHFPDLYLLPVFTNLYNDVPFYVAGDGKYYANAGGRDLLNRDFFASGYRENYLPFVERIVTTFRDEPNIFAWEIGNELKLDRADKSNPADPNPWTFINFNHEIAAAIKRLDSNHLVTTGMKSTHHAWLHSAAQQDALYTSPNIDFVTIHSYEGMFDQEGDQRVWDDVGVALRHNKPFIVEEAGFDIRVFGDRAVKYREHLHRWFAAGACGYMPWGFVHAHDIGDGDKFVGIGSTAPDFGVLCDLFRNFASSLVAGIHALASFVPTLPMPSSVGVAGFDFLGYNRQFMDNTGHEPFNDAARYGVRITQADVPTGEHYWRVIGVHHLTPDENKRRHHVYVDVLDEQGQRVRDPNLRLAFNWESNPEPPPEPKRLDKPDNEAAADVPLNKEATYRVWLTGAGPSDVVADLHTRHPDENDRQGEAQNTFGHHSYYVVFQRARKAAPVVVDGGGAQAGGSTNGTGEPTPPVLPPPPVAHTQAKDKLGIDANRPIDPATGAIAPQVADPSIILGTGVGWVRLNFVLGQRWQGPLDQSRPAGLTWAETYRRIIDGFRQQGLRVYGLISAEAMPGDPGEQFRGPVDGAPVANDWIRRYADTFVQIAELFHREVDYFETFNEPDDWHGGDRNWVHPQWFAVMLEEVHNRVRNNPAIRHIKIISGPLQGLHADDQHHNNNGGAKYLNAVYQAGRHFFGWGSFGKPFPFDGVGYHLYIAQSPANSDAAIRAKYREYMDEVRQVIRSAEGGDKPIFLSEFGWQSSVMGDARLVECMRVGVQCVLDDPSVALGIWFCTQDFAEKFGLYREGDLSPANRKPVHDAFKAMCQLPLQAVVVTPPAVGEQWIGAVTAALLNLRLGPGTEHVQIGSLVQGTEVEVVERVGAWVRVNVNGQQGFVHADFVRFVRPAVAVPSAAPRGLAPAAAPAMPARVEAAPELAAVWRQQLLQNMEQSQALFRLTLEETMNPQWLHQVMAEHLLLINSLHLIYNSYWVRLALLSDPATAQAELSTITQETLAQMQTLLANRQRS